VTLVFAEAHPLDETDWDSRIEKFASKRLFHERAWLRFVARAQHARIRGARLLDEDGATSGYFCAGEVRIGPLRLLGSPLRGWNTPMMGPVTDEVTGAFLDALDAYCRSLGVDYVEIGNPALPRIALEEAGFTADREETLIVPLGTEAAMWAGLSSECRNRIRRGMRSGLRVERVTDRSFVDTYYAQLCEVFARQSLVPTYGSDRVEHLWDELMPAGRLLALRVVKGDDVLATGLFPFDDRMLFFWGGASWIRAYASSPNELLHWHAMLHAAERAVPIYDMSGTGRFKAKFGGAISVVERWYKPLTALARFGRPAYARYVQVRQRVLGRLRRLQVSS
jgi:hypothetical protein